MGHDVSADCDAELSTREGQGVARGCACAPFCHAICMQLTCFHLRVSTGRYSHMMDSPTSSNWLIPEVRTTIISSLRSRVMRRARLRSVHLSDSRRRARAGSKVPRLQAPVWAVQGDERGDRNPPDRSDQLGESHRGRWDLVLSRTSTKGDKKRCSASIRDYITIHFELLQET